MLKVSMTVLPAFRNGTIVPLSRNPANYATVQPLIDHCNGDVLRQSLPRSAGHGRCENRFAPRGATIFKNRLISSIGRQIARAPSFDGVEAEIIELAGGDRGADALHQRLVIAKVSLRQQDRSQHLVGLDK